MKRLSFILTFFTLLATPARADLLRQGYEGVRPTGMGNAFLALSDDANALFYNPAGLARVKGVHFHLFDLGLGVDNQDTLNRVSNAFFQGDYENLLKQNGQYLSFNVKPTFIAPYFGFSFFNQAFGYFDLQNLAPNAVIDVYAYNDLGAAVGFGLPMGDYFSFGLTVKAVSRTGVDLNTTPQDLILGAGVDQTTFEDNIYDAIKSQAGTGYGFPLTAGLLITIPEYARGNPKIRLAATVDDVGDTSFTSLVAGESGPKKIRMSYNFGALFQYDLTKQSVFNLTFDARHQFENLPFMKTFHAGAEYRHKYFGLRAGLYQGYASFGASLEFPPHTRLHFSSYSSELGSKLWEREKRWYMLQLVIGFNPL